MKSLYEILGKISGAVWLLALALLVASCSSGPKEIHYGEDECAHCKMMIMDASFASQIVTKTGKAYKFDAIECMAAFIQEKPQNREDNTFWVSDFNTDEWLEVNEAVFVKSDVIKSPMGMGLLAFDSKEDAQKHIDQYAGEIIDFNTLLNMKMEAPQDHMEGMH